MQQIRIVCCVCARHIPLQEDLWAVGYY